MMVEFGPFMLNENSVSSEYYQRTKVPELFYNEFGWQKVFLFMTSFVCSARRSRVRGSINARSCALATVLEYPRV